MLNNLSLLHCISLLTFCLIHPASSIGLNIVEEEVVPPQNGRICAYGDFNKDRYTDLVLLDDQYLVVMLQSENGHFSESNKFGRTQIGFLDVECVVGDFNGDAFPDIMVTWESTRNSGFYESILYIYNEVPAFISIPLNKSFVDPPSIMDVNGDGISDVLGFVGDRKEFICLAGSKTRKMGDCTTNFPEMALLDDNEPPYPRFSHIFADIDGDLGAEIIFGVKKNGRLHLQTWKLSTTDFIWISVPLIDPLPTNSKSLIYASPSVADFNADGFLDILLPVCQEDTCEHIERFFIWSGKEGKWTSLKMDMKDDVKIVKDEKSSVLFRVGDFSLDGYPDLIATVNMNQKIAPMIIENVEFGDNSNFSRKFELKTKPRLVMPEEMANGDVKLAAFFDLKEDGNLDLLVEYKEKKSHQHKVDFIKCDDKGDTTFLKVQIFTNVCTDDCPTATSSDKGSGITWHGACVFYTMSDSWGKSRRSEQCQLPQTSQRALYSPFALFGLGRSPNFVDEVRLGSPRFAGPSNAANQHSVLKQIVPNSRVIVIPPGRDGTHWQSRLYLTPSQLIIQSLLVLLSVCAILLLVALFLHVRERQQDRKERQAMSHRFHFDAM